MSMNINAALGMVSERPLQVGDWVELINGESSGLVGFEWPQQVTWAEGEMVSFASGVIPGKWWDCRFRRVDPPRERDEVAELREKLEQAAKECGKLKSELEQVTRERDELQLINESLGRLNTNVVDYSEKIEKERSALREQLSTVQAEAAVMRRIMDENESRLNDVIRRIGSVVDIGWIKHELRFVLQECNATAGRDLLDEMQRKDDRIADLERQLADHKRDAELCRELRALLKLPSVTIGSDSRTLIIYTPRSFEIQDKFREIRDGGAK